MSVETPCPVDLAEGLARAGDDRGFYKELLEIFAADVPGRLDDLAAAVAAEDAVRIGGTAHSIKGAAANLSAHRVREAALALEQAGRSGDVAGAGELLEALRNEVDRLLEFTRTF